MPRKRRLESHQRAHIHVISESVGAHIQIIRSRVSCEFTMRLVVKRLPAASAWHVGRATLSTKHLYSPNYFFGDLETDGTILILRRLCSLLENLLTLAMRTSHVSHLRGDTSMV